MHKEHILFTKARDLPARTSAGARLGPCARRGQSRLLREKTACLKGKYSSGAFTLTELLIVLAIIGVITAVVFGSLTASRSSARDSRRISDIKSVQLALAVYYDVNRAYPATLATLTAQKYISLIPVDPAGAAYGYLTYNSNKNYCMSAQFEAGAFPSDNVASTNPNCDPLSGNYKVSR